MNKITTQYSDYSRLIKQIGEKKIEERLDAINELYHSFLKDSKCEDKVDILLNERVLIHSILDYFTDITRLKEFHDIDLINKDKIIAYEISWFLKRKPIQIISFKKEELVYINEKFALAMLVNHLTNGMIDNLQNYEILNSFCEILLYFLKFRNYEPKVIEIIISSFKAGNSINSIVYD